MSVSLRAAAVAAPILMTLLTGCGLTPPKLAESWEAADVSDRMVFEIKRNIICETIDAIRAINRTPTSFGPPIPDDYGVQLQLTLTVAESSSFNGNIGYNKTLRPGAQSGVAIGRNFSFGVSGDASATATRVDTTYSYWRVGGIAGPGKNKKICHDPDWLIDRRGSSRLLISDLGIERFLKDNVQATTLLHSSKPSGTKKPEKIDVYSYDLKFAVVTGGSFNPAFKMVSLSGGGAPIFGLSRTRTHQLLLTFGPTGPDGFQPSDISFSQHLANQYNAAAMRRGGGLE